jgi:hypothetical protein
MPTTPEQCANYARNLAMCPCTSESCGNRGICCECISAHLQSGSTTSCMRGDGRSAGSAPDRAGQCAQNLERNLTFCTCTWEPCGNRGTCCNCVDNHFSEDGSGRTACMK